MAGFLQDNNLVPAIKLHNRTVLLPEGDK